MSKQKASKLDPYAERLEQWFTAKDQGGDGLTLAQAQAQLKLDGCVVSLGRLSEWWQSRQSARREAALLAQIASGSRQCAEVEKQFGKNPPPELDTLIKLHRVLILQLSTQGNADPEFLKLADQLMRTALEFVSGQTKARFKERELSLAEEKFQFNAAKLALQHVKTLKAISSDKTLSDAEKVERARQKLFGEAAE